MKRHSHMSLCAFVTSLPQPTSLIPFHRTIPREDGLDAPKRLFQYQSRPPSFRLAKSSRRLFADSLALSSPARTCACLSMRCAPVRLSPASRLLFSQPPFEALAAILKTTRALSRCSSSSFVDASVLPRRPHRAHSSSPESSSASFGKL
jgi:hypothetical protein